MNTDKTSPFQPPGPLSTTSLASFFALAGVESIGSMVMLFSIPPDPKNAVFLGYSLIRWIGAAIFGALLLGSILLTVKAYRGKPFPRIRSFWESPRCIKILLGTACAAAWLNGSVLLLPGYRLGTYEAWLIRLQPLLLWLLLVSTQTIVWVTASILSPTRQPLRQRIRQALPGLRPAALTLCAVGAVWAFMSFTKTGLAPDDMFWNGSAPPLLLWQVFGSMGAGLLFFVLERRLYSSPTTNTRSKKHLLDLATCLILWTAAVLVWNLIPQQDSYFAPGPYPPNDAYYPYSDAAVYDLNAEFAVIGRGFTEQEYVDKPFYSWLLFILHRLTGNDFSLFTMLYTALMAGFIPIVYLIGRALKSRPLGIAAAAIALFYETNAMAATLWINAPNARLLLTEPACRLGLALFTLWFLQAQLSNTRKNFFLVAAGGALGLSTMIRYNAWFVLPIALLWIALTIKRGWKQILLSLVVFLTAFLLPLLPWMLHTSQTWVTPYFFLTRFQGTVWMQRYLPYMPQTEALPEFIHSPTIESGSEIVRPTAPLVPRPTQEPVEDPPTSASTPQYNSPAAAILDLSSRHFFHNLATSVLALPDSLMLNDVEHIIKIPNSHWLPGWDQTLNLRQIIFLAGNLALLGAGIGFAFREKRMIGLAPLAIYLGYNLGSAFARTSGGRYLAPIVWIALVYYLLGWLQVIQFGWQSITGRAATTTQAAIFTAPISQERKKIAPVLAALLLIGLGIPMLDQIIPSQHLADENVVLESYLEETYPVEQISQIKTQLDQFLKTENAVILSGKGLYPRYYQSGEGEVGDQVHTREMAFSRLTFTLIRADKSTGVILPLSKTPESFPHGAVVTVIGCKERGTIDAIFVIVETEQGTQLYRRAVPGGMKCPLAAPVSLPQ